MTILWRIPYRIVSSIFLFFSSLFLFLFPSPLLWRPIDSRANEKERGKVCVCICLWKRKIYMETAPYISKFSSLTSENFFSCSTSSCYVFPNGTSEEVFEAAFIYFLHCKLCKKSFFNPIVYQKCLGSLYARSIFKFFHPSNTLPVWSRCLVSRIFSLLLLLFLPTTFPLSTTAVLFLPDITRLDKKREKRILLLSRFGIRFSKTKQRQDLNRGIQFRFLVFDFFACFWTRAGLNKPWNFGRRWGGGSPGVREIHTFGSEKSNPRKFLSRKCKYISI